MDERYRPAIQLLHWLVALIVVGLIAVGLVLHYDLAPKPVRPELRLLHMSFGISILVLMVVRFFVRRRAGVPPLPATISPAIRIAAHATQMLLYLLLLAMPVFGILFVEAHGKAVPFFGLFTLPAVVGKSEGIKEVFEALHFWGGITLVTLLLLHVGGAIRHEMRGEPMIRRMLPRRSGGSG